MKTELSGGGMTQRELQVWTCWREKGKTRRVKFILLCVEHSYQSRDWLKVQANLNVWKLAILFFLKDKKIVHHSRIQNF